MPEENRSVIALRHWSELGRMTRAHRRAAPVSWERVERLVDACNTVWRAQSEELRKLLEKSNSRFAPLVDPLLIDFDLHRWLVEQREEAYSDWLEWLVKQLPTLQDVFHVFGIQGVEDTARAFSTKREEWIKPPRSESYKRLDLVIRGQDCLLVIEVKKKRENPFQPVIHEENKAKGYTKKNLLAVLCS